MAIFNLLKICSFANLHNLKKYGIVVHMELIHFLHVYDLKMFPQIPLYLRVIHSFYTAKLNYKIQYHIPFNQRFHN